MGVVVSLVASSMKNIEYGELPGIPVVFVLNSSYLLLITRFSPHEVMLALISPVTKPNLLLVYLVTCLDDVLPLALYGLVPENKQEV